MPVEFISSANWEKAHGILARTQQILADRPRVTATPGNGAAGPVGDVYEDAQDDGRHVLPLVRQELARRQANGTAPILNPDSAPESDALHAYR